MSDPQFDTTDVADLLQTEHAIIPATPVIVEGLVRTDEMPCEISYGNRVLKAGASAEKILSAEPRRRRVLLWIASLPQSEADAVCLGSKSGQAQAFTGSILPRDTVHVRLPIATSDELWVRPCNISYTSTTFAGFTVTAADTILSWIEELWSK